MIWIERYFNYKKRFNVVCLFAEGDRKERGQKKRVHIREVIIAKGAATKCSLVEVLLQYQTFSIYGRWIVGDIEFVIVFVLLKMVFGFNMNIN
jgi:hypothetical protein